MAAMKKRLDKYASRMNEGEKELIWRQINAGNPQESRRRRQFWTALGASGSLVAAGLILVVMLSGEDPQKKIQSITMSPEPRTMRVAEGDVPESTRVDFAHDPMPKDIAEQKETA